MFPARESRNLRTKRVRFLLSGWSGRRVHARFGLVVLAGDRPALGVGEFLP
jgi:hypothetical protein